nr:Ig-like domain-containing protein [Alphaproteobacteria bacterium]
GGFDTATASINVFGVNDAPVAEANKMIIVGEGQSAVSLNISAPTDFDTSDTLTITINGLPTNGLVTFANGNAVGNGQTMSVNQLQGLKFAANANADDSTSSFNYTVSDGNGGSDSSTVTVNTLNADHTLDYVGSYEVNDGPYWGSNPAVYSGVQAAALIFGGNANEYAISTNSSQNAGTVTNTAWYDGWGEHSGMVFADTYRLDVNGDGYAYPGGGNTARSAYVSDGLSDAYVNYVWREGIADETVPGGAGNDVIGGGGGDATLIGVGGDDLFVFNIGGGDDTVNDFVAGAGSDDALDISDFGFANLASLLAVTNDAGANTVIQLDANDSITLIGVNEAQLHQDDFLFT